MYRQLASADTDRWATPASSFFSSSASGGTRES
ncbi:hypothetical protein T05_11674 [Trichinella murrelli]|uniref:Uncharacterized protein n=1 Tax=Trichinella murrelli TaxID=144512 RepID=A0A0V0SQF4_9BILA|nr:hypothetical protein T05_11674 [Trichinella murrelli]